MKLSAFYQNETAGFENEPERKNSTATVKLAERETAGTALIRFEEKKDRFIWAHPDEIFFVKSADHYVKSLIKCGKQIKWMTRHCTLKELLVTLPPGNFIRLNKFYLLNRNHFAYINENEKKLYLDDDFSIPVPHRISRFVLDLLKK
jgi:DNA-binding LytR/AlgR family response regulator